MVAARAHVNGYTITIEVAPGKLKGHLSVKMTSVNYRTEIRKLHELPLEKELVEQLFKDKVITAYAIENRKMTCELAQTDPIGQRLLVPAARQRLREVYRKVMGVDLNFSTLEGGHQLPAKKSGRGSSRFAEGGEFLGDILGSWGLAALWRFFGGD